MIHLYRCIAVFLLIIFSIPGAFSQGDRRVYLQSGTITAPYNLEEFINAAEPADQYNGYYYRFLHFSNLPGRAEKEAMQRSGLILLDFLPTNTFMAAIPRGFDRSRLRTFQVYSVIAQEDQQKISRNIVGGFQSWAVKEKGTVDLNVQYHGNIPHAEALRSAGKFGTVLYSLVQNHLISIRMGDTRLRELAAEPWVFYINTIAAPSVKEDTKGRSLHRSNVINSDYATGRHYDGDGVTVAIADDGFVGPHIDFTGRITNFATGTGATHGDMTSGICAGAGNLDPNIRGMATGSYLYTFDISGYPQVVDALSNFNNYGIVISSTSYSQGCNEYTADTQFGDQLLYDNPQLEFVFSAGNNNGADCGYGAGGNWGNITGGYKQGKNVVACGNLDALEVIDPSSSHGPSADGRIKPDICSNGRDQLSTDEDNTYQVGGGTSAASPGIAGIFAQLYQAHKQLTGDSNPPAALLKASLLNTAEDIGNPGPDYTYGWGRVNAFRALTTIEDGRYLVDSVTMGTNKTHTINVPAGTIQLRAMVYWADPGGSPVSAKALVNDLNISITDPGGNNWNPWVLNPAPDPTTLNSPAVRGVDSLNNMEQVTLDNPVPGVYTLTVNGYALPSISQKYYVVWEFRSAAVTLTYPNGGEGFVPGETEVLRWDGERNQGSYLLEYSADNGTTWTFIATPSQTTQQYSWSVPNIISGAVKVRVSRNGSSDESDSSLAIIRVPSGITVDWACPDSIRLVWTAVPGASGYIVYRLGSKYMDPVATSPVNEAVITGINPNIAQWFSVAAVTNEGNTGRRAKAIFKTPGTASCPLAIDLEMVEVVSPGAGVLQDCQDNSSVTVSVNVENRGQSPVWNIPLQYSVNGGTPVVETFTDTLQPGAGQLLSFSAPVSLSQAGTYTIRVINSLQGDLNSYNDTVNTVVTVIAGTLATVPFIENFDSLPLCGTANDCEQTVCNMGNGWINAVNQTQDDIDFRVNEGATPSSATGPDFDHTLGQGGGGNYVYLEASACFNKTALLITPCIDLGGTASPQMTFWYHMYGASIGELHIDLYAQGVWIDDVIPVLIGNKGNQWLQASLNLTPWSGDIINIRFRAVTGGDYESDIALDDINIIETTAPPVPVFSVSDPSGCTGKTFTFTDQSLNAPNSWSWVFNPSTVTFVNNTTAASQNPQVVFNVAGSYNVTLTATNGFGASSQTQNAMVSILDPAPTPVSEDFQGSVFPPSGWSIRTAGGAFTWTEAAVTGADGNTTDAPFVNNFSYNNPGAEDGLETFEIDLQNAIMPILTFDVSYARYSATFSDSLRVDISTDCGTTWQPSGYLKGGVDLATVPDNTASWSPSSAADWRKDTVSLSAWTGENALIRFININRYGNNVYVDNISVDVVTGESETASENFRVYPNPTSGTFYIQVIRPTGTETNYTLIDAQGRSILSGQADGGSTKMIRLSLQDYPAGTYFIRIQDRISNKTLKINKL